MWDTAQDLSPTEVRHLMHDLPCHRCGHGVHTYLACSDTCDCTPCVLPGAVDRLLLTV